MNSNLKQSIKEFLNEKVKNCRVLVVGDVMLDRYFYGKVTRISPEAPVPVNLINEKQNTLGGAGNVAHNLARLGCKVYLTGLLADDHHGRLLINKMRKVGINTDGVIVGRDYTTTKVRILGGHQQMMRLDFEETEAPTLKKAKEMLSYVEQRLQSGLDVIIISDYGKGVCTENICQNIIKLAHESKIKVLVDPKGNAWSKYINADYITPNVKETGIVIGEEIPNNIESLRKAANKIANDYSIKNVVITRSEKGISIFSKDKEFYAPTVAQEVFDVSGAGDTVISVLAAGIAGNMDVEKVMKMANIAAGVEVRKLGTYAVSNNEIILDLFGGEK
mgnify:FL=1